MQRVRLWVPESDYDQDAVRSIAKSIIKYYNLNIEIGCSSKSAFQDAMHKHGREGIRKAVDNYLKTDQQIIFLLDLDGIQSITQRRKEPNSLVNVIERVASCDPRVKLIFMDKELEAWFLVDVLGICCFYQKNKTEKSIRTDKRWTSFSNKRQCGKTEHIIEATAGGRGVKEHLVNLSRDILKKLNRNMPIRTITEKSYKETDSAQLAPFIEISAATVARNCSLGQFADLLKNSSALRRGHE